MDASHLLSLHDFQTSIIAMLQGVLVIHLFQMLTHIYVVVLVRVVMLLSVLTLLLHGLINFHRFGVHVGKLVRLVGLVDRVNHMWSTT